MAEHTPGYKSAETYHSGGSAGVLAIVLIDGSTHLALRIVCAVGIILLSLAFVVSRTLVKTPWTSLLSMSAGSLFRRLAKWLPQAPSTPSSSKESP